MNDWSRHASLSLPSQTDGWKPRGDAALVIVDFGVSLWQTWLLSNYNSASTRSFLLLPYCFRIFFSSCRRFNKAFYLTVTTQAPLTGTFFNFLTGYLLGREGTGEGGH